MRVFIGLGLALLTTACAPKHSTSRSAPLAKAMNPDSSGSEIQEGLGFHSINAPGVPAAVTAAAGSVVQLKVPDGASDEYLEQIDVSNGQGQAAKDRIMATQALDELDKIVVVKQIENCEHFTNVDDQKTCIVSKAIHGSTGFIAGDGRTLWTNAHVIEPSLNFLKRVRKVSHADQLRKLGRVAVYVFSRDGTLLVDPNIDAVRMKITPEPTALAKSQDSYYGDDSDYFALTLKKAIAAPLRIANTPAAADQPLFLLGFPACTNCTREELTADEKLDYADRAPRSNSDGLGIKLTFGTAQPLERLQEFFRATTESWRGVRTDQMLFYTADSQQGSSGGPVLNLEGEVVAIHAGGKGRMIEGRLERVSRAVIPPQFH